MLCGLPQIHNQSPTLSTAQNTLVRHLISNSSRWENFMAVAPVNIPGESSYLSPIIVSHIKPYIILYIQWYG